MKLKLVFDTERRKRKIRLVPRFGSVVEQVHPVARSCQPYCPIHGVPIMAAFTLTDSQQTTCTISAVDKKGNPVALPPTGSVTWGVDSPAVLALAPSADGLSCVVAAVGPLGDAVVSVKVSDSAGATLAAGTLAVTVTAGNATSIAVNPATPTEQP